MNAQRSRGAESARTMIPLPHPIDAGDADAGLWCLVAALAAANADMAEATKLMRALSERGDHEGARKCEREMFDSAFDAAQGAARAIWCIPARTPRGLMVKLALAYDSVVEQRPPEKPLAAAYFLKDSDRGGDTTDLKAINSLWQDAVAMFGPPPELFPGHYQPAEAQPEAKKKTRKAKRPAPARPPLNVPAPTSSPARTQI